MGNILFENNATSRLASEISDGATTFDVTTGTGDTFPTLSGGDTFKVTLQSSTAREIVLVTARSGDTFSITRAQEGTIASGFAAGDSVSNFLTAGEVNAMITDIAGKIPKTLVTTLGDLIYASGVSTPARLAGNTTTAEKILSQTGNGTISAAPAWVGHKESIIIAVSDESTAITTGTAKVTFRMPFAMTLTAVRSNLNTASSSGLPTVDIKQGGSTILSTLLSIDASELTSVTAATPAVISTSALTDDAVITIDITVAGTGAKGLKVTLTGTRA